MNWWPIIAALLLLVPRLGWTLTERVVTSAEDVQQEGTLRTVLHHACDTADDDIIRFATTRLLEIRIHLYSPLVIPLDCQGRVTIIGSPQVETILDAHLFADGGRDPGDHCIVNIYSDGHLLENFTYAGNTTGAGVCLFGRDNAITTSWFGRERSGEDRPNRFGVVISRVFSTVRDRPPEWARLTGEANVVEGNNFAHQGRYGLWIAADRATLTNNAVIRSGGDGIWWHGKGGTIRFNRIEGNGGCPDAAEAFPGQPAECVSNGLGGAGIWIAAGSSTVLIGDPSDARNGNIIQYNHDGGIVLEADVATTGIWVTHNLTIARNYGRSVNLDLAADGFTPNDLLDHDDGPNALLNFPWHLQFFPLVQAANGAERYWAWGYAPSATKVELATAAAEDIARGSDYGGSDGWQVGLPVQGGGFSWLPPAGTFVPRMSLTSLAYDAEHNTSEFGLNVPVGPDADLDGIIDPDEVGGVNSSAMDQTDTDDDGLPDPIEDRNRNGVWNPTKGETMAFRTDSDNDGLTDWIEVHGDGDYAPAIDTDPLASDTDQDGLVDGAEDANHNGRWDGYLKETSPRLADSDGDGVKDASDSCPMVPNPGQEPWACL